MTAMVRVAIALVLGLKFAEFVTKQERNADTKLIVKAHNIDMVPNGSYSAIKIVP